MFGNECRKSPATLRTSRPQSVHLVPANSGASQRQLGDIVGDKVTPELELMFKNNMLKRVRGGGNGSGAQLSLVSMATARDRREELRIN